jgi:hypothetical protein
VWSTSHNIIEENHCIHNINEDIAIFISVHNMARVSPSPEEQMKLLTHGGKQHRHDSMNEVQGIEPSTHANPHYGLELQ